VLAKTARALFGDNLFAVRLFPALAGTLVMVLAGLMVREFGGGKSAQALAMVCVLAGSLFLRSASLFQPVVLDQLCWSLALFTLVKYAQTRERRWWVLLGIAGGLGLLTKFSILFLAFGMAVGLALSRWRRSLVAPWPYLAVLIALVLGSPTLIGQLRLDFPVATHMQDLRQQQLARVTPAEFLLGQVLMLGPAVLVALAGVVYLLRSQKMRDYRVVGYSCLVAFLLLLVLHGKPYYIGPIYPALFAAGAAALDRASGWFRLVAFGLILSFGVLAIPFGLPILPPAAMAEFAAKFGPKEATKTNRGEALALPQDYADMIGWEE
jgi:4-amino-4-deoxy-L-arabinose transferase-like glycosyltransferase